MSHSQTDLPRAPAGGPPPDWGYLPRAEPSYIGVVTSARRYPLLVILPILLFVGAALFIGLRREPVYTARAQLEIGRLNVTSPGALAGFATASQALAVAYSRAVDGDAVLTPVARRLGTSERTLRTRVSASPIEGSPVFRVSATGRSEDEATTIANAVSDSLIRHVTQRNRVNPDTARLYGQYRDASAALSRANLRETAAERRYEQNDTASNRRALERARTAVSTSRLRVESLQAAYTQSQQSQAYTAPADVLTRATSATSDRDERLQMLGFLGLLAGGALGLALAALRANRLDRRPAGP